MRTPVALLRQCAVFCCIVLMACSVSRASAGDDSLGELLIPPAGKVLFGAFTTMDEAETLERFNEFGQAAGKHPAIHLIFRDWTVDDSSNFPKEFFRVSERLGAVPMISWEPWFDYGRAGYPLLKDIARGRYDGYIETFLRDAAEFDQPWFLRFAHEMEAGTYPWASAVDARQSPSDYTAAFRHVASLARRIAPKTVIVWSPNSGSANALRYFPGAAWVDWVGASLYNFPDAPQDPDHRDKLEGWVAMLRQLDKPGMIAEMGCAEHYTITQERVDRRVPGTPALRSWMDLTMADKSVCLDRTFDLIEAEYPEILALVWFDIDKDADWRIDSSPASLPTFASRAVKTRYLGARTDATTAPD